MMMKKLLLICAIAVAVASAQQRYVEVATRYITPQTLRPDPLETMTFVGTLCKQYVGQSVNATMLLNHNPAWNPIEGVVNFYIVDDPKKTEADALCTNKNSTGYAGAYCVIPEWCNPTDLYLRATAGDVVGISFSIDVDIAPAKKAGRLKNSSCMATRSLGHDFKKTSRASFHLKEDVQYLTEVVTVETSQRMVLLGQDVLNVTFCPNSQTTPQYQITSTVFATDGESSYAQYVCVELPCDLVHGNIVKSNPNQLPVNNIILSTSKQEYTQIYLLIVCWAGPYDPAIKNYVGQYQYSANIRPGAIRSIP